MTKEKLFRILKEEFIEFLKTPNPWDKPDNCYCIKCGKTDQTRRANAVSWKFPDGNCPNNAPWQEHDWHSIGPVGDTPYVCTYCGARVNSDGEPKNCECIRNKAGHNWVRG